MYDEILISKSSRIVLQTIAGVYTVPNNFLLFHVIIVNVIC